MPKVFVFAPALAGGGGGGGQSGNEARGKRITRSNGALQKTVAAALSATFRAKRRMGSLGSLSRWQHYRTDGNQQPVLFCSFDYELCRSRTHRGKGWGCNPFFFVNEAGQGYVMAFANGTLPTP